MTGRRLARWPLLAFGLAMPAVVGAQTSEVTVRVSLPVVEPVGRLEITPASTNFGTLSSAAIELGYAEAPGPSLAARANHPFSIVISAPDPFSGPTTKLASDLEVATTGVPLTPLSSTDLTLFTSSGGGTVLRALQYRWLLGFASDPPGAYELDVELRLAGG